MKQEIIKDKNSIDYYDLYSGGKFINHLLENKKRLKFMDLVIDFILDIEQRKKEDKKRNDLTVSDCSDLFNKLWEETKKLFK